MNWQLQEAKNKFSQVVKLAREDGPQIITVHGQPSVVVLAITDYERLNNVRDESLAEFLSQSPLSEADSGLVLDRQLKSPGEIGI
ncbi:MAG: antitoxin Phd [Parasphingorhabdus sp.]|jgi:antitoxin Phd